MEIDFEIVVIGAGAAGMVAAAEAAQRGQRVVVLEKANKAGVKILMSGGTRCNLTHNCDAAGIMKAFGRNGRFLRQALAELSPTDVVAMFARLGVPTKVEETGKVFPTSDRALDVARALEQRLADTGAKLMLGSPARNVTQDDNGFRIELDADVIRCRAVIVTVGGMSYPGCGTVGDGYEWMRRLGHTIVAPRPALVPIVGGNSWSRALQGVTLPKAGVTIVEKNGTKKKDQLASRTSGLLFTHFGFSGPAAMDVSRAVTCVDDPASIEMRLSSLPDWNQDHFQSWLAAQRAAAGNRFVWKVISEILPRRLAVALVEQAGIESERPIGELSSASARRLCSELLDARLPIEGTRGFKKAEVTAGGVSLKEVDPRTMRSRLVEGLYIAGELLDLDGWIGGYNFQSAFSTGLVAGRSAAADVGL